MSPAMSRGRYAAFCSAVPKSAIGSTHRLDCPPNVVANDAARATFSTTTSADFLSRSRPPVLFGGRQAQQPQLAAALDQLARERPVLRFHPVQVGQHLRVDELLGGLRDEPMLLGQLLRREDVGVSHLVEQPGPAPQRHRFHRSDHTTGSAGMVKSQCRMQNSETRPRTAAVAPLPGSEARERIALGALPERDPRAVRAKHFVGLEGGLVGERAAAFDVVPQIDVRHAQRACALDDRQHVVGAERPRAFVGVPVEVDRRQRLRQPIDVADANQAIAESCSAIPRSRRGCPGRSRPRRPPDSRQPFSRL